MRPEGYAGRLGDLVADYGRDWRIDAMRHGMGYRAWRRSAEGGTRGPAVDAPDLDGLAGGMDARTARTDPVVALWAPRSPWRGVAPRREARGGVVGIWAPGSPWRALTR